MSRWNGTCLFLIVIIITSQQNAQQIFWQKTAVRREEEKIFEYIICSTVIPCLHARIREQYIEHTYIVWRAPTCHTCLNITWIAWLGNSVFFHSHTLVDRWLLTAYTPPNHLMLMNITGFLHSSFFVSFFSRHSNGAHKFLLLLACAIFSCMCFYLCRRVVLVLLSFFRPLLLLLHLRFVVVLLYTQFRQRALQMTTIIICLCSFQTLISMYLWIFFFFVSRWPILNYGTIYRNHLLKRTFDMEHIVQDEGYMCPDGGKDRVGKREREREVAADILK